MSDFIDKDRWINLSLVHEREIYGLQGKIADQGAEIERLKDVCVRNQNVISELLDRCVKLKADLSLLRLAGDAMAERLEDDGETHPESDDWWDAKNGGISK